MRDLILNIPRQNIPLHVRHSLLANRDFRTPQIPTVCGAYFDRAALARTDDSQRASVIGGETAGVILLLGAGIGAAEGQQLAALHRNRQLSVGVGLHNSVCALDVHRDVSDLAGFAHGFLRTHSHTKGAGGGDKLTSAGLTAGGVIGHRRDRTWFVLDLEDEI